VKEQGLWNGFSQSVESSVRDELRKRALDLTVQTRLAAIQEYGEDNYPDGTVVSFSKVFAGNPETTYTYAGIRIRDKWYITGNGGNTDLTWYEFLQFLTAPMAVTDFSVLTDFTRPTVIKSDVA
jgi:hypothetical protein